MLPIHEQLFLDAGFVPDHVETNKSVIYLLGPQMDIVYCNASWDDFALANGGEELQRKYVAGTAVLSVTPEILRPFYHDHLARVQQTKTPWEHDFECSSPVLYRLFHMRVIYLGNAHLLVENSLRIEHEHGLDRPPVSPGEHIYVTKDGIVTMCMHCRRTRRVTKLAESLSELADTGWDWVPAFGQNPPDYISHGVCRMCYPRFFESLNA